MTSTAQLRVVSSLCNDGRPLNEEARAHALRTMPKTRPLQLTRQNCSHTAAFVKIE